MLILSASFPGSALVLLNCTMYNFKKIALLLANLNPCSIFSCIFLYACNIFARNVCNLVGLLYVYFRVLIKYQGQFKIALIKKQYKVFSCKYSTNLTVLLCIILNKLL